MYVYTYNIYIYMYIYIFIIYIYNIPSERFFRILIPQRFVHNLERKTNSVCIDAENFENL